MGAHGLVSAAGDRIRAARKAKGLTLREVGALAGVSAPYLLDVETGRRAVSLISGPRIARVLDLVFADLHPLDAATLDVALEALAAAGGCDRAVVVLRELRDRRPS